MRPETLYQKLDRRELGAHQLAESILGDADLLRAAVDGLYSKNPRVNYPCVKALRIVSRAHTRLVYPYFNSLVDLLRTSPLLIQNQTIFILANLARVDTQNKLEYFLDAYFVPLQGPNLLTAKSVVKGAVRLLAAKPELKDQIAGELLRVQKGKYENKECRRIIYQDVLDAIQTMQSRPQTAGMVA